MSTPYELVPSADNEFVYSGFRLHEIGLSPIGTPSLAEWKECGRFLRQAEKQVHFWVGDWLAYGQAHFKEDYEETMGLTGYSYHTLRRDKYTAERIPLERRRPDVDIAIHHEVAPLPQEQQKQLLEQAVVKGYTVQQLRVEKHRIAYETARPVPLAQPDAGMFLGDCREVLATVADESIDLLLTDPPYGISYVNGAKILPFGAIVNDTPQTAPVVLEQALAIARHKLKNNSHVFIFTHWRSLGWMFDTVAQHFDVKTVLCWVKNKWAMGDYYGTFPSQYELVIHAQKGRRHLEGDTHGNVLVYDRVLENHMLHPTEKPLPLLEYLIGRATRPGEIVCDPFMGSATTCLAARNTDRKYIGIEIDNQWFSVAQQRLAGSLLQKAS